MLNKCTRSALMALPEMKDSYTVAYASYKTDVRSIRLLQPAAQNFEVIIVLGIWCGDSRLQVPRFYKVLDEIGIPEDQITLISVNEMKKAAPGLIEELEIERVPTFIIMDGNKEIGRIVESPVKTLEEDLVEIVTQTKKWQQH